ncbi:MAG: SPOR domain-containing protein [Gemmatimonadaceae bacterium]
MDSLDVGLPQRSTGTALGDRVYLAVGRELLGVPVEDFKAAVRIKAPDEILAVAPTPSGDRIFVASKGEKAIDVIDRYSASVTGRVRLPGFITELRMDPLGRYLLARPVDGDSAWVVAIGTESLVGAVHTIWREDLPLVAPGGAIATLLGSTVDFVDPVNHASMIKIENGDSDFWFAMLWNGFRPRAKGLDRAVTFQTEESLQTMGAARGDSSAAAVRDTTPAPARASQDAPPREETPPQPPPREPAARSATWIVSFAAVLSEDRARELARSIRVEGAGVARVSVSHSDGTAIYRVLMGPYSSRAEADRIGKASGHTYWITEGNS